MNPTDEDRLNTEVAKRYPLTDEERNVVSRLSSGAVALDQKAWKALGLYSAKILIAGYNAGDLSRDVVIEIGRRYLIGCAPVTRIHISGILFEGMSRSNIRSKKRAMPRRWLNKLMADIVIAHYLRAMGDGLQLPIVSHEGDSAFRFAEPFIIAMKIPVCGIRRAEKLVTDRMKETKISATRGRSRS